MFYENRRPINACELLSSFGAWLNYGPDEIIEGYDYRKTYSSSGVYISKNGPRRIEAFAVRFRGRQRFSIVGAGHGGFWRSEFDVHEMISAKPIPSLRCDVPFP
jgi:hypothetical protein